LDLLFLLEVSPKEAKQVVGASRKFCGVDLRLVSFFLLPARRTAGVVLERSMSWTCDGMPGAQQQLLARNASEETHA
jgi:hypothetical protein